MSVCKVCGKNIGTDWWNGGVSIPYPFSLDCHETCFLMAGGGMENSADKAIKAVDNYIAKGGKGIVVNPLDCRNGEGGREMKILMTRKELLEFVKKYFDSISDEELIKEGEEIKNYNRREEDERIEKAIWKEICKKECDVDAEAPDSDCYCCSYVILMDIAYRKGKDSAMNKEAGK